MTQAVLSFIAESITVAVVVYLGCVALSHLDRPRPRKRRRPF